MPKPDWTLTNTPGHYFSRIARGLARIGDRRLKILGVASAQLPVLTALKDGARLTQRELAAFARVEQPTMAQLLARMERDGLIKREPDPNDRRSSLISLTKATMARLPAGRAILHKSNTEVVRGLSGDEIATLMRLLAHVLANVEAMEDQS